MFQITIRKDHDLKPLVHEVSAKCKSKVLYFVVADESIFHEYRYVEPDEPNPSVKKESKVEYVLWVPTSDDI